MVLNTLNCVLANFIWKITNIFRIQILFIVPPKPKEKIIKDQFRSNWCVKSWLQYKRINGCMVLTVVIMVNWVGSVDGRPWLNYLHVKMSTHSTLQTSFEFVNTLCRVVPFSIGTNHIIFIIMIYLFYTEWFPFSPTVT